MTEFLDTFLNESADLINKLEANLFEAEKHPDNPENIQQLFRHVHTLKGAAGMYGFEKTGAIAHYFENIFDRIRNNEEPLTRQIIDLGFETVDILRNYIQEGKESPCTRCDELLAILTTYNPGIIAPEPLKTEKKPINKQPVRFYYIYIIPDEKIFYRGLSPFIIVDDIHLLGNYIETIHEGKLSLNEQDKQSICTARWEIYLATSRSAEEVEENFLFLNPEEYLLGELPLEGLKNFPPLLAAYKKLRTGSKRIDIPRIEAFINANKIIMPPDIQDNLQPGSPANIQDSLLSSSAVNFTTITDLQKDKGIFVSSGKLDEMMNLVSTFVTTYAELELLASQLNNEKLHDVTEKLERLSKRFRDNALSIRLVPIRILFQQFQRLVRDLSRDLGKEVEFIAEGIDTELDKAIVKALESPLMHIIRNSIDHGLEAPEIREKLNKPRKGLLKFISYYSGAQVNIQIQDDGAGINLEKVRAAALRRGIINENDNLSPKELIALILRPGFTTAENVSMVSGRGVGMDVVYKEIEKVHGSLEINTEQGLGTIITIMIPLTLSIIDTLYVTVDDFRFLIPLSDIDECLSEYTKKIEFKDIKHIVLKGHRIPFIDLRKTLNIPTQPPPVQNFVIIRRNDQKFILLVDKIKGEHQAVIKPLGRIFESKEFLSGASVLGDGKLAYILDAQKLLNFSNQKFIHN